MRLSGSCAFPHAENNQPKWLLIPKFGVSGLWSLTRRRLPAIKRRSV
jgi:hypothetical protein